mgnify:CR=1 FL=1
MTFPSVYEMFVEDLTTVRKQHFWDYFSGATLNSRWTQRNVSNSNTFAMEDSVDGGFKMTTSASADSRMALDFNSKRQYDQDACEFIGVLKTDSINTNQATLFGLANVTTSDFGNTSNGAIVGGYTSEGFMLRTSDGTTVSATVMEATLDTNWHSYKMSLGGTNVLAYRDGVLEATKSTNYPTAILQPYCLCTTGGAGGARTMHIKYMEAYNT